MLVSTRLSVRNIINIAKNVFQATPPPTPLGRWKVCENKNINLMVDYANEDHCGSCSQYSIDMRDPVKKIDEVDDENDLYSYEYEYLLSNTNTITNKNTNQ
jgi:hypothetical protein